MKIAFQTRKSYNIEIGFAHQSFKWTNNAKGNAGVTCVIVGLRNKSKNAKTLFSENHTKSVFNISPYLTEGNDYVVEKRSYPISNIPKILRGSGPVDGGHLIMSESEKTELLSLNNNSSKYIRPLIGALELMNGEERYCLWITDEDLNEAIQIDPIRKRVDKVKEFRIKSKKKVTQDLSSVPYKFGEIRYKETNCIIVPRVTSERREYVPVDFLNSSFVISDSALAVYDAEPFYFGLITSKMHNVWLRAIGGRLETRIRYSALLCYNTFPFPPISEKFKQEITQCVFRILEEREKHPEKTLAQLYDPDNMPEGLREAHRLNDLAVESCYRSNPFVSDDERLDYLFKLYEKMNAEEQEK